MTYLESLRSGRLTQRRITDGLRRLILDDTGHDVGILSFEKRVDWHPCRNGYSGDYRIYWVQCAYPGRAHFHIVTVYRDNGEIVGVEVA